VEGAVPEAAGRAVRDAGGEDCARQEGVPVAQVRYFKHKLFVFECLNIAGDSGVEGRSVHGPVRQAAGCHEEL
jgi:hypothetical protein